MVGEIRDVETADVALKAALTGHLVLSTLHTNDAPGAIIRLVNMDLEPFVIASALRLILALRLIRRLCQKCPQPDDRWTGKLDALGSGARILDNRTLYRATACADCLHTGHRGRIAIHEALQVTEAIEPLIVERAAAGAVRVAAREAGMQTLRESALRLVADGVTSLDEALEHTTGEDVTA